MLAHPHDLDELTVHPGLLALDGFNAEVVEDGEWNEFESDGHEDGPKSKCKTSKMHPKGEGRGAEDVVEPLNDHHLEGEFKDKNTYEVEVAVDT